MSDRGFGESCGTAASRASVPARQCAHGYIHLLDTRYEVRDAQYFAGQLADEGLVSPTQDRRGRRLLRRRHVDGARRAEGPRDAARAARLVPWRSPRGKPMRLAAATPAVPWTDLAYALTPNGRTLDYVADAPYRGPYGVLKSSYVNALYATGCGTPTTFCTTDRPRLGPRRLGRAAQPGRAVRRAGDRRGSCDRGHDLPLVVLHRPLAAPPAPLLIANGWTDDLFPVDEALRFYNRTTTQYPRTPISLFFLDFGHPRAQNKAADQARYVTAIHRWLDFYVKGEAASPSRASRR